jgi:hypothetical protein
MVEVVRVSVARFAPVHELDGGLVRTVAASHPFVFGEPEIIEEYALQVGDRRLADADLRDRGRLEQRDAHRALQRFRKVGGGHPSGRPAAKNDDFLDGA